MEPQHIRSGGSENIPLTEIADQISPKPDRSQVGLLERVAVQLESTSDVAISEKGRDAAITKLAHFLSLSLKPLPVGGDLVGDKNNKHRPQIAIIALNKLTSITGALLDDEILLTIIPYVDATAPWSTDVSADTALKLLSRQFSQQSRTDFIVSALLEAAVRPRLSNWSSARLTAAGRVAEYEGQSTRPSPVDLGASPPWADESEPVVPLFLWALDESDATLLESHWPSFTPLLLALLDDPSTRARVQGLRAAELFIQKCPARVLAERGIGKVLEEAMLPTLQFLPSHTPEAESAQLLDLAYRALALMARMRFAYDGDMAVKRCLLDKLLREGIFSAYAHASEYIRIVEVLAVHAKLIIDELGIYATKHLKDIIPMFTSAMTDPFLAGHGQALLSVADALHSTILNCWPRVLDHYNAELLRSTVICWLNMRDSQAHDQMTEEPRLAGMLQAIAKLVTKGLDDSKGITTADLDQMIDDKPRLRALFH